MIKFRDFFYIILYHLKEFLILIISYWAFFLDKRVLLTNNKTTSYDNDLSRQSKIIVVPCVWVCLILQL